MSRPPLSVPFGPFLPDQPSFASPGLTSVQNAIPRTRSYGPMRELIPVSDTVSGRVLGAVTSQNVSGTTYVYAGTASTLEEMVGQAWTDQSVAGGYSTASDDNWEFAVWGDTQKIIATNYTDAVQSMTIGAGSSSAFAAMITSTNKPKAKHLGIVSRFVVLGATNDTTDGARQSRVWWSGIGDETDFDPAASTQCDFEDLSSGGQVQRIIGGTQYGLIFQRNMVRTMQYIGGTVIFELLPISYAPGTAIPQSVIPYFGKVFYIADDGFMALNGVTPEPIGNARVDRAFAKQFDINNKRYVSTAVDPINKIVAWAFPGEGSAGLPNKLFMCKYDELKWTEIDIDTEYILSTLTQGYTLDGLDSLGTDIDDATVFDQSLDAEKWKGNAVRFGAFDQFHQLGYFNGSLRTATFETGDLQPVPGRRWQINSARLIADGGGGVRIAAAARTRLNDSLSYGPTIMMNTDGLCPMRSEGRYQRIRVSLSASTSWSHVQGLELDFVLTGGR